MRIMRKLKAVLLYIFGGEILYLLSFVIPKDKNLWVFGAWFGEKYADNSKYLFEYVCKNHPDISAVWLTKNKTTLELIRNKGFNAVLAWSFRGIVLSLRARCAVLSTSPFDVNEIILGNTKIVQLWHGTPLKKIMYDDTVFASRSRIREWIKNLFPFFREEFLHMMFIAPSEAVARSFSTAFKVPQKQINITGYPRNDSFFSMQAHPIPLIKKIEELKRKGMSVGIYMPTHRLAGKTDIFSLFYGDINRINDRLSQIQVVLLVKFHFYHLSSLKSHFPRYSNIIFIQDADIEQDVYTVLPRTDFLITDYSSIYFDYLLLGKPVIFTPFDKDEYLKNDREFYYEYDKIILGPKAYTWDEVLSYLAQLPAVHKKYEVRMKEINGMFNTHVDGNNSRRVFDAVQRYLGAG